MNLTFSLDARNFTLTERIQLNLTVIRIFELIKQFWYRENE